MVETCKKTLQLVLVPVVQEFFMRFADELTAGTLIFRINAFFPLLVIKPFVAFRPFHFPPQKNSHDRGHAGPVLNVLQKGVARRDGCKHGHGISPQQGHVDKGTGHGLTFSGVEQRAERPFRVAPVNRRYAPAQ